MKIKESIERRMGVVQEKLERINKSRLPLEKELTQLGSVLRILSGSSVDNINTLSKTEVVSTPKGSGLYTVELIRIFIKDMPEPITTEALKSKCKALYPDDVSGFNTRMHPALQYLVNKMELRRVGENRDTKFYRV